MKHMKGRKTKPGCGYGNESKKSNKSSGILLTETKLLRTTITPRMYVKAVVICPVLTIRLLGENKLVPPLYIYIYIFPRYCLLLFVYTISTCNGRKHVVTLF